MILAKLFVDKLVSKKINRFSGVPCSYLNSVILAVQSKLDAKYIPASSEGEALAMMSGGWIGGSLGAVLCQNSGLGNMINPLTSLNMTFHIPVLLIISIRGQKGMPDEPQHELMGKISYSLLDLIGIPWKVLPKKDEMVSEVLDFVLDYIYKKQRPAALIIGKETFSSDKTQTCFKYTKEKKNHELLHRHEIIRATVETVDKYTIIIATTGKTGRELYTLSDRRSNLYCVGSMGYANAIAHGIALTTSKMVIILDGDGAAIMHLGNLSTIGALKPKNLVHVVLDNNSYDSTGGQDTISATINFVQIARNMGYQNTFSCITMKEYVQVLSNLSNHGPTFIYVKIKKGSIPNLVRPAISPHRAVRRLRGFIRENQDQIFT